MPRLLIRIFQTIGRSHRFVGAEACESIKLANGPSSSGQSIQDQTERPRRRRLDMKENEAHDRLAAMLAFLRNPSPTFSGSLDDLINAPKIFVDDGRYESFSKVVEKWFRVTKPTFDELGHFDAPNILRLLGKLNRDSGGLVLRRFGSWKPIDYFLQRMMQIGFDRFSMLEIVKSFNGLVRLQVDAHNRKLCLQDELEYRLVFDRWLTQFEQHISNVSPLDTEYDTIMRRAPMILSLLSRTDKRPSEASLRLLARLSKASFDRQLGFGSIDYDVDYSDQLQCAYFVTAFAKWRIDPETFVPGSWRSLFDLCALGMRRELDQRNIWDLEDDGPLLSTKNRFTWDLASCALTAAHSFDSCSSKYFWRNFSIWKLFTKKALREMMLKPKLDDRVHVPNFIYNAGQFARKLRGLRIDRRGELEFLLPLFDEAMVGVCVGCSRLLQGRALTGFRDLTQSINLVQFSLSDAYFFKLRDWCVEYRLDRTNSRKASDTSALFMMLLREMQLTTPPPPFVLRELAALFRWGLDDVRDEDLSRALSFFGDACSKFCFDPTEAARDDERMRQCWDKFFEKARRHLELNWPSMQNKETSGAYVLSVIIDVACDFGQVENFNRLRPIFETRLKEIATMLPSSKKIDLRRRLEVILKDEIDSDLVKSLK